jgi:hypothetical protein
MALPLPERWRAPVGVNFGVTRPDQLLDLASLEVARDSLVATDIFQSGF